MPTVFIPSQLRTLSNDAASVQVTAANVGQIVDELEGRFPGIRDRLCTDGQLSPNLQVSIDGVMSSRGLRAKVEPDSEVHFLPALVGG